MRKILSLVLVLALVLGSFPAFAAVDQNQVAAKLKGYGVLIGDEKGDLMLDKVMTREQSLVTLSRLMGVEAEAKATSVQSSFSDAGHSYYGPFIAYAELKGWTKGIGGGKFGFGQTVTVQQYMTFMLRALGYAETPYADTMKVSGELGLLKDMMNAEANAKIKRGDAAVAMYNTLMTKPANNELTLVYVLGLEKASTLVAEYKTAKADSLKQLKVYFTAPIKKAGDHTNWSLKTSGDAVIDKESNFELSEDGMMVTITLTKAAKQQEIVDLKIDGLLKDDIKVEDIQFLDLTIPSVVGAEVIGIDTVKVTFSEPMNEGLLDTSNYKVVDGKDNKFYVKNVKAIKNNTEVWVELYSNLKDDIKVTVSGVKDYQGYAAPKTTLDVKVVVDKEAPYVVDYEKATPKSVTLIFNEDIEAKEYYTYKDKDGVSKTEGNKDNTDSYYHTNKKDNPESVKVDGNKLTLKFDDDTRLPNGTAYVYVLEKAVNDLWDNHNDKLVVEIKVVVDKTAPEVKKIEVKSQSSVLVTFTEDVFSGKDFKLTLLKDNGKKADISAKGKPDGTDEMLVKFGKDIFGDYSLVIEDVEDAYANTMSKTTVDFTMEDETPPAAFDKEGKQVFKVTAYNIGKKNQFLVVDFAEKMDVKSITDKDNYWLTDNLSSSGYTLKANLNHKDVDFKVLNNGEQLKISIPADTKDKKGNLLFKLTEEGSSIKEGLRIGRLVDASGNKMTTFSANLVITNGDNMKIDHTGKLTSAKTFEITCKDRIVKLDADEIDFYVNATPTTSGTAIKVAKVTTTLNNKGNTVIKYTFEKAVRTDAKITYNVKADAGENEFGKDLRLGDGSEAMVDEAAPEVLDAFLNGTTTGSAIYVVFSEDIDGATLSKGSNGFTVTDGVIESVKLMPGRADVVVITHKSDKDEFDLKTEFSYDGKNDLADGKENKIKAFEYKKDLKKSDTADTDTVDNPLK